MEVKPTRVSPIELLRVTSGWAHLVVDPVEQAGHDGDEGGAQGSDVVRQQLDVALREAHAAPCHVHQHLGGCRTGFYCN